MPRRSNSRVNFDNDSNISYKAISTQYPLEIIYMIRIIFYIYNLYHIIKWIHITLGTCKWGMVHVKGEDEMTKLIRFDLPLS